MFSTLISFLFINALIASGSSKPVMVSFGTNEGPIVPRPPTTTRRPLPDVTPAPVFERPEDVPNPLVYKPLVPHQYRSNIFSHKPNPNLILGTPLDIKYTSSLDKYFQKKKQAKVLGIDYTGPQFFEKQDYEYEVEKQRGAPPSVQEILPQIQSRSGQIEQHKLVPQIGIVYSSGLRYYIPQIFDNVNGKQENSIYDKHEVKFYQNRNKSYSY